MRERALARGVGVGSRQDFVLPTQWETKTHMYTSHEALKVLLPGKKLYHNMTKVKDTIRYRGNELCLDGCNGK